MACRIAAEDHSPSIVKTSQSFHDASRIALGTNGYSGSKADAQTEYGIQAFHRERGTVAGSSQRVYVGHRANSPLHPARYPVEERGKDLSVIAHIQRLVAEEHRLFEEGELAPDKSKRLADVQVELDQCWDLLRQRRGVRESGGGTGPGRARAPRGGERDIGG